MASNDNWISRKVQGWVAGAGNAAGGAVNAVGNGVSGTGRGIGNSVTGTTRGWADSVRSYGNAIKDATGASGPRAATGSNPLGLSGTKGIWSPSAPVRTTPQRTVGRGTAKDPLGLNSR
ncbi:uncharacterized protein PV09_04803 [Verruconis gallopava]|uniref:Uncharacterized protein n=1 Tax=Verruconis gallopava TaxID=253628 RepID=A0A0D2AXU9_9PEZI|nr:uncharacterized protein PV09_04803 [Verruconis gallopava]KIW03969.1 hypothetical protein PV09_04803 [Verruconis gallopava]